MSEPDAALYEAPFEYAKLTVAPARLARQARGYAKKLVAAMNGPDRKCGRLWLNASAIS